MTVKACVFIIIFFLILLGITLLWVFNIAFKMIRDSYKESKELEKMSLEEYAKRRSERTSKVSDLNECVKQAVKKVREGLNEFGFIIDYYNDIGCHYNSGIICGIVCSLCNIRFETR